jgi:murein L,D-transpeptidase YafK
MKLESGAYANMSMTGEVGIVIHKTERRLTLSEADGSERNYAVVLGKNWAADKAIEGDHATPVGDFYVCAKNSRSRYFLSLCLSYPNVEDAERGLTAGLISADEHAQIIAAIGLGKVPPQYTKLGGEIYIHGHALSGGSISKERDWTRGCIALDNTAMQEVYDLVKIGTKVSIVA